MELMRAINEMRNEMREDFGEVRNCLWGPNRDNGLVTATSGNSQRICRLERLVYGVIGAVSTVIVGVGTALIIGVI
jgi:hypothetical protein